MKLGFVNFKNISIVLNIIGLLMVSGCSDNEERPETVNKLRALGVAQEPVNAMPGDTVELTYYLAAPPALQLTATASLDDDARYSLPIVVTPKDAAPIETNYGALSLYSYKASLVIPATTAITSQLLVRGFARVRSDVKFSTDSGDSEVVVADTIIYAQGASQLGWTAPTIDIVKPDATGSAGNLDIEGSIVSTGDETNRVSWFVSSGKVKNRRAKISTWENASSGSQTLFLTARGTKSGAFAIKALNVSLSGD